MTKPYVRLDKNDAAVLLVDHQAGLLSLVRDIEPDKFKNNVLALGDLAKYFNLPTILTTSFETGPNGPLVPELKAQFPDTPYIARPGNINAWDNEDFVKAVKATGKKQLIIAGVVTEVCVAFPALSAIEEGFDVFVVTDVFGAHDEGIGGIQYKTKWYPNGMTTQAMYLTVMHRPEDNGLDFNFEHQKKAISREELEYLYYYLCKIMFKGAENPELTIGEIIKLV